MATYGVLVFVGKHKHARTASKNSSHPSSVWGKTTLIAGGVEMSAPALPTLGSFTPYRACSEKNFWRLFRLKIRLAGNFSRIFMKS